MRDAWDAPNTERCGFSEEYSEHGEEAAWTMTVHLSNLSTIAKHHAWHVAV